MSDRGSSARPASDDPAASTARHEEELQLGKERRDQVARIRKVVERSAANKVVDRDIEHADVLDHVAPNENDSGEVEALPDGSVSIPVFEEELVVSKRMVLRERVIVRKRTVTEQVHVKEPLRKERVKIKYDEAEQGSRPETSTHARTSQNT